MDKLPLDRLFFKKLELHKIKYKQIYNIFYNKKNYLSIYHSIVYLRDIIKQETQINQRIVRKMHRLYRRRTKEKVYFYKLAKTTNDLIEVLKKELVVLKDIGIISVIRYDIKVLLFKSKKQGFLMNKCLEFKRLFDEELEVNKELIEQLYTKNVELNALKGRRVRETKQLLTDVQNLLRTFVKSIGDKDKVLNIGKELIAKLDKIQDTTLYEFVKKDAEVIRKKVDYVMKHPKQNKLAYLFTGIYLVAPGTFELTGAILAMRYLTKYTLQKSNAINTLKKKSIRRKIKRSIKKKR